ncbi:hypothetical protein KSP39_PZI011547 [Platanthera zijinensis]|uniref:Retrotransposon gag domain-containing protein n=1 Tax=Platanthera zijinensis TaxID=2320716 RepID=A0AAP0BJ63_9ASPA
MFGDLASLRQGNASVAEYMGQLKDMLVRCDVREMPEVTLSRFRKGLNPDIQGKLLRYGHTDLNTTFNAALDIEKHNAYKAKGRNFQKGKSLLGPHPSSSTRDKGKYRSTDSESIIITARNNRNPTCERSKPLALLDSTSEPADIVYGAGEESNAEPSDIEEDSYMMVMRCILATPRALDEYNRTNIFTLNFKCGEKWCKLIIDSGSYMNVVSENAIARMHLVTEPHPHPYKIAWVNKTSIAVSKRCLVPLTLKNYVDKVWCDVIPMDVCHVLLGRPWLYDYDVTHFGRANTYEFKFNGKTIVLKPSPPKDPSLASKDTIVPVEKKTISLISRKELERETFMDGVIYALVCLQAKEDAPSLASLPLSLRTLLDEYKDVYPVDLPPQLPPMRDI